MAEKPAPFDPAEGLTSDEAIAAFLAEAFAFGDAAYLAHALGVAGRARAALAALENPPVSLA